VRDESSVDDNVASDIVVDGTRLSFSIMTDLGGPVKVDFSLDFEDTNYTGNINVASLGDFPIKGSYDGEPKLNF
jgi:hypothetical protein